MSQQHQKKEQKRQNLIQDDEEEDGLECLSFRDLAGDSCTCIDSLFPPYTDGDLEFEFLPVVIPDNNALAQVSNFYPVFGVDDPEKKTNGRSVSCKIEKCNSTKATGGRFMSWRKSASVRLEDCMPKAPTTRRSMSGWKRLIDLLIGKKKNDGNDRIFFMRNKSTSQTPKNSTKKVSKDNSKRLTYLPYRSNLTALFPVNRYMERSTF